jgi:glyoxylase-like metal-dependent hydrolase (beta-lactamase superfamily II)
MLLPLLFAAALAADDAPRAPAPQTIAPGVTLIAGAMYPGRGPDGNTVIFEAPDGLVVVDTGRHVWHSDAILAFARERDEPIDSIINTHWHLDHASGNRRIKAVFPNATIFATDAVDRTLEPGGFLERNVANARARAAAPDVGAVEREERENFLATMDASQFLRPTLSMQESGRYNFAHRRLDVHISTGAVTDADIWLYDRRTRVAVLGDLVTFPSPFFETACPDQWRTELDRVWATPFRIAIPGHGAPMTRAQFDTYRRAFGAFIDCVDSETEAGACAAIWSEGVATLASVANLSEATEYATYYVGYLRENGGKTPTCLSS